MKNEKKTRVASMSGETSRGKKSSQNTIYELTEYVLKNGFGYKEVDRTSSEFDTERKKISKELKDVPFDITMLSKGHFLEVCRVFTSVYSNEYLIDVKKKWGKGKISNEEYIKEKMKVILKEKEKELSGKAMQAFKEWERHEVSSTFHQKKKEVIDELNRTFNLHLDFVETLYFEENKLEMLESFNNQILKTIKDENAKIKRIVEENKKDKEKAFNFFYTTPVKELQIKCEEEALKNQLPVLKPLFDDKEKLTEKELKWSVSTNYLERELKVIIQDIEDGKAGDKDLVDLNVILSLFMEDTSGIDLELALVLVEGLVNLNQCSQKLDGSYFILLAELIEMIFEDVERLNDKELITVMKATRMMHQKCEYLTPEVAITFFDTVDHLWTYSEDIQTKVNESLLMVDVIKEHEKDGLDEKTHIILNHASRELMQNHILFTENEMDNVILMELIENILLVHHYANIFDKKGLLIFIKKMQMIDWEDGLSNADMVKIKQELDSLKYHIKLLNKEFQKMFHDLIKKIDKYNKLN